VYKQLRDETPVYHNEEVGFWALSRYEDVVAAHLDTDTFSSAHGVTIEGYDQGFPPCSSPRTRPSTPRTARSPPGCSRPGG
jgi:cytochrome P450